MSISICIICLNEETNILRCLQSATWADEIIVVDSMSQDKTVEIAKQYTDHLYQREWTGYTDQKNYALSLATGEWVLSLDADEEVSEGLRDEILFEIKRTDAKNGYLIPRRCFFQGRWINHGSYYPNHQLRLFKRDRARWVGKRVHERVEIRGEVGVLKNDLLHYPYRGIISEQLKTVNEYSGLVAENMHEEGKRYHLWLLLLRPFFKFMEVYFLKLGFLDGVAGFIIAVTSSYTVFVRYVKLRELEKGL